jgi:tRNA-specific 2-thiouridylase
LSRTIFPLGAYIKNEVREIASSLGLHTSDRPDSQDFISGGDYTPFFNKEEIRGGEIADKDGKVLGRHRASSTIP